MGKGQCPRADELEALATTGKAPAGLKKHADVCPLCTMILHDLRDNAQLLADIRAATAEGLDQASRERVREICERLAVVHCGQQRTAEGGKKRD